MNKPKILNKPKSPSSSKTYLKTSHNPNLYTISKFATLSKVTEQTLRNWDKSNILKPHHISSSGYRYYSHSQLIQVQQIKEKKKEVIQNKIKALKKQLAKFS